MNPGWLIRELSAQKKRAAKSAKFGAPQLNSPRVNQNPRLASSSWPFWTGSLPPGFITQESNFHSAAQQWYDHRSITKNSDFSDSSLEFGTNIIRDAPGNLVLFVNYWLSQRWTFRRKSIQYICIQYTVITDQYSHIFNLWISKIGRGWPFQGPSRIFHRGASHGPKACQEAACHLPSCGKHARGRNKSQRLRNSRFPYKHIYDHQDPPRLWPPKPRVCKQIAGFSDMCLDTPINTKHQLLPCLGQTLQFLSSPTSRSCWSRLRNEGLQEALR